MNLKLVCHVKNSFEYIPAFLAYHEKLFDEVHIVDQCSDVDLRDLNQMSDNIHFYRTSYSFFNAMIGTNAVLEFKSIRQTSDFVFVLDIDEFLPFSDRSVFEDFLQQYQDADAIRFQWMNGLNCSPIKDNCLQSDSEVRFFNKKSSVVKLAYNAKKTTWFLPYHGNHNAKFHYMKFAGFKKKRIIKDSELPLYHIPFSSVNNLREKIESFDKSEFLDKLINRHEATRDIFQKIEDGSFSQQDLYFFVANYRTIGHKDSVIVTEKEFEAIDLFSSVQERIIFWAKKIEQCPTVFSHPSTSYKEAVIRKMLGEKSLLGRYFFYQSICSKLFIDDNQVIQFR